MGGSARAARLNFRCEWTAAAIGEQKHNTGRLQAARAQNRSTIALDTIKSASRRLIPTFRAGTSGGPGIGGAETGEPVQMPFTMLACTEFTEMKLGSSVLNTGPELVKLRVLPRSPCALAALPTTAGKFGKMNAPGLTDIDIRKLRLVLVGTLLNGPTRRGPLKVETPWGQIPSSTPVNEKEGWELNGPKCVE